MTWNNKESFVNLIIHISLLYSSFGLIKSVRLPKKMAGTGSHRGFAFVDFTTKQDAKVKIWMILFKMFRRFCWKCFEEFNEKALENSFEKGPCNVMYAELWFLKHRILKLQDSQLRMRINTKPNGKQKWSEDRVKWHFCWLGTSLPMYLESKGLRTDHKQVKNIET